MYVPKHRLDTTTDAALDASVETAIQTARLSRRGVLGAVAVVGITGGAASAASFAPSKKRHMFHNKGRVVNKGKPHPNRTPSPSPAASATSSPTASATPTGTASATPTATASATPTATASATPTATATATPTATPTATASATPTPTSSPTVSSGTGLAMVGMSTPATLWAQRVSEVGPGLASRRIFADLASGAGSQIKLVEAAHAAGMLPVISYKVGGDIAGAVAGKYNAVAEQAAAKLASYGYPTAVTFWHEPNPDISAADYVKASKQLLPAFKQGKLKVGPILNGWLLDNQQSLFASFAPDEMFELWDWFGIDTYESGTASSPGKVKPAVRIPALADFVKSRGANLPLGVGEYNGWSGTTIAAVGEALMTTPNVWFGCVFNNDAALGSVLTGDRLTAFRQTLADPRSAAPRTG